MAGTGMKSASVRLPGSGENLQITPKGLLKATSKRSGQVTIDQVLRHRRARHGMFRTAAGTRIEPLAHVGVETYAVHVVVERLAQPGAEVVVVGAGGILEVH